jgi:hypothetical protein
MARLMARLERMERLVCPRARVHVVAVPAESVHDKDVVARAMVVQGIHPSEHDLVVLLKKYTAEYVDAVESWAP